MQTQLFNETPPPGTYVPPKIRPGATPLALVALQTLLDRFGPVMRPRDAFERPWLVTLGNHSWSVAVTQWMLLAVRAPCDEAVPLSDEIIGHGFIRKTMAQWFLPASAQEMPFERLAKPAGAAQWPAKCGACDGTGWRVCCPEKFCSACMDFDGMPPCEACEQEGTVMPDARPKTLCGQRVNVNLLACAFETLRPAVAPASSCRVWAADDVSIRAQGESWRLLVMKIGGKE